MDNQTEATPVVAEPVVVPMITLTIEVPKELHEVGEALVSLVKSIVQAKADGFNMITDVPTIVLENLKVLGTAIDNIGFVKTEVKEKLAESISCISVSAGKILKELMK